MTVDVALVMALDAGAIWKIGASIGAAVDIGVWVGA